MDCRSAYFLQDVKRSSRVHLSAFLKSSLCFISQEQQRMQSRPLFHQEGLELLSLSAAMETAGPQSM